MGQCWTNSGSQNVQIGNTGYEELKGQALSLLLIYHH